MKGHVAWNKGIPFGEETRHKMSESAKKRGPNGIGHHPSLETRMRWSEIRKGRPNPNKGKHFQDREKLKEIHNRPEVRLRHSLAREGWVTPKEDTFIERKVQSYLDVLGVPYVKHEPFHVIGVKRAAVHKVDLYLPTLNLVIECDGERWHSLPEAVKRDTDWDEIISKKCDVLRLNGTDIINGVYEGIIDSVMGGY